MSGGIVHERLKEFTPKDDTRRSIERDALVLNGLAIEVRGLQPGPRTHHPPLLKSLSEGPCCLRDPLLNQRVERRPRLGQLNSSGIQHSDLTLSITGSKKQSEERAALFAVRVHAIVRWHWNLIVLCKSPSSPRSGRPVYKMFLDISAYLAFALLFGLATQSERHHLDVVVADFGRRFNAQLPLQDRQVREKLRLSRAPSGRL